jgi:hypothetical protein
LLQYCHKAYLEKTPQGRRLLNQAFAEPIYVDGDAAGAFELDEAVNVIRDVAATTLPAGDANSNVAVAKKHLVGTPPRDAVR